MATAQRAKPEACVSVPIPRMALYAMPVMRDNPCAICVFGGVGGWGDRLLVGVVPKLPHQRTPHDLELERVHRRLTYEVPARPPQFPPEIRLEAE